MSEIVGKRVICDRCEKEVFVKYVKSDYYDGGFTRSDSYEKLPDGWYHGVFGNHTRCPECDALYKKINEDFWRGEE